ncbi:MAG: methylated-DNA--[protein]-cysteine S-methyltransferase [Verrucomicrobiota bacterium]
MKRGIASSPFGPLLLAGTEESLSVVFFAMATQTERLDQLYPEASWQKDDCWAEKMAAKILRGPSLPLRLEPLGTAFQKKVWTALQTIPSGSTRSYSQIARQIGQPGSARAVGQAVGANPLALVIPCHRVLPSSGGLGGYRWGVERKRALLAWESRDRRRVGSPTPAPPSSQQQNEGGGGVIPSCRIKW